MATATAPAPARTPAAAPPRTAPATVQEDKVEVELTDAEVSKILKAGKAELERLVKEHKLLTEGVKGNRKMLKEKYDASKLATWHKVGQWVEDRHLEGVEKIRVFKQAAEWSGYGQSSLRLANLIARRWADLQGVKEAERPKSVSSAQAWLTANPKEGDDAGKPKRGGDQTRKLTIETVTKVTAAAKITSLSPEQVAAIISAWESNKSKKSKAVTYSIKAPKQVKEPKGKKKGKKDEATTAPTLTA